MKIAYRVQAVPEREATLDRLLSQLPQAEVIVDDGSPVEGEWLVAPDGPWRGYVKVLTAPLVDSQTRHICVLQDDCIVCENFTEAVEKIVATRPSNPICLFTPGSARQTVHTMMRANGHLVPLAFRDFLPVVAVVWPVELAASFIEWTRMAKLPGMPRPPKSDDAVAGAWKRHMRQDVYVTVPSLVEHPDDVPSTVGRRAANGEDKGRVAAMYIGERDPLEIDWS